MKIKLVPAEQEAEFIRHARAETLKSIDEEVTAEAIEPSPFALYLIAYDGNRPVALAEIAFHDQVYESFAKSPYPQSFNLDSFCPFDSMAGIRTIYVEPDYRQRAGSIYLQLIFAGGLVVGPLGARFATATTNAADAYLNRLYRKTGGKEMETFVMHGAAKCEVALYVFDLNVLLNHKLIDRVASSTECEIDLEVAREIRSRSRWDEERRCA